MNELLQKNIKRYCLIAIKKPLKANQINDEKITTKGLIKTMSVIDGIEYVILNSNEQLRLDTVLTFNGRKYKEE